MGKIEKGGKVGKRITLRKEDRKEKEWQGRTEERMTEREGRSVM